MTVRKIGCGEMQLPAVVQAIRLPVIVKLNSDSGRCNPSAPKKLYPLYEINLNSFLSVNHDYVRFQALTAVTMKNAVDTLQEAH
jgi:hypothetical protein